jgi:DeoR/GlpR family transcriptional regulator of sugar metabolism
VTLSSQAGLEKIAHIITDNRIDTAFIGKLTQMGIKVTTVKSKP